MSDCGEGPSSDIDDTSLLHSKIPETNAQTHSLGATEPCESGQECITKKNWRNDDKFVPLRSLSAGSHGSSSAGQHSLPFESARSSNLPSPSQQARVDRKENFSEQTSDGSPGKTLPVKFYRPPHAREAKSQGPYQRFAQGPSFHEGKKDDMDGTILNLPRGSRQSVSPPVESPQKVSGSPSEQETSEKKLKDKPSRDVADDHKTSKASVDKETTSGREKRSLPLSKNKKQNKKMPSSCKSERLSPPIRVLSPAAQPKIGQHKLTDKSFREEKATNDSGRQMKSPRGISPVHQKNCVTQESASRKGNQSSRASFSSQLPLHQHHFQYNSSSSGGVSPSNRLGRNISRSNALIQTEPFLSQDHSIPLVNYYAGRYTDNQSGYASSARNMPGFSDQWRSLDALYVQVCQSPFLDILPHYVEACIGVKESEKKNRQKVFEDVQAVAKAVFGHKADARIYGSVMTDLALPFSDIDILIVGYHPTSPLEAIHALSSAILELTETSLAEMNEAAKDIPVEEDLEDTHKNISGDNSASQSQIVTGHLEGSVNSIYLSSTQENCNLDPPDDEVFVFPDVPREKEQYKSSEDLESAETVYRDQIEKDYNYSRFGDYRHIWAPVSTSISAPTELSKGTNTDNTPVAILPHRISAVDTFHPDDKNNLSLPEEISLFDRKVTEKEKKGYEKRTIKAGNVSATEENEKLPENVASTTSNFVSNTPSFFPSSLSDNTSTGSGRTVPPYYTFVPTLEGSLYRVQTITSARVPVIKITEKRTGQRADITFGGGEHFRSLQMTRNLVETFPHARLIIRFLKHCVSRLGISEPTPGGVTSFVIYLLVMHFYNAVLEFYAKKHQQQHKADTNGLASAKASSINTAETVAPQEIPLCSVESLVNVVERTALHNPNASIGSGPASSVEFSPSQGVVNLMMETLAGSSDWGGAVKELDIGDGPRVAPAESLSPGREDVLTKKEDRNASQEGNGIEDQTAASYRWATEYLLENVGFSTLFRDFCYYYGCAFNFETSGIRFSLDGKSEVVGKPYQCARRGQLIHLTSPFDPDYDLTARMTCMREFQWLCESFITSIIPFSFSSFLHWFNPADATLEITAVRDHLVSLQYISVNGVGTSASEETGKSLRSTTDAEETKRTEKTQDIPFLSSPQEANAESPSAPLQPSEEGQRAMSGEMTSNTALTKTLAGKPHEKSSSGTSISTTSNPQPGLKTTTSPTSSLSPVSVPHFPIGQNFDAYRQIPGLSGRMYGNLGSPMIPPGVTPFMAPMYFMRGMQRTGTTSFPVGYTNFYDPNLFAYQMVFQQRQPSLMDGVGAGGVFNPSSVPFCPTSGVNRGVGLSTLPQQSNFFPFPNEDSNNQINSMGLSVPPSANHGLKKVSPDQLLSATRKRTSKETKKMQLNTHNAGGESPPQKTKSKSSKGHNFVDYLEVREGERKNTEIFDDSLGSQTPNEEDLNSKYIVQQGLKDSTTETMEPVGIKGEDV